MLSPFLTSHTPPNSISEAERRLKDFGTIRLDDLIGLPWQSLEQLRLALNSLGWAISTQEPVTMKGITFNTIKLEGIHQQNGSSMKMLVNVSKNDPPYAFIFNVFVKGSEEEDE